MRPFKKLISLGEALKIADRAVEPVEALEKVDIKNAGGRILAKDICAQVDVPPFHRAAMDGFAVKAEDTFGSKRTIPAVLNKRGEIFAGEEKGLLVEKGNCLAIATGAVLPDGADAVVMVENTEIDGEKVEIMKPVYPWENVSRRGEDIKEGNVILKEGDFLNPGRVGALSAVGLREVPVYIRPRISVVPTGEEITEPGDELNPGQIYNVNSYTLIPLIQNNGCMPITRSIINDTLEALESLIDETLDSEIVIFSGGSSVGERDLIVDLIDKRGKILFHGIMVKPGKPTILGKIEGTLVLGMPGYPTSCLSNGYLILEPMLRKLARLPLRRRETLELVVDQRIVSTIGRHQFYPVKVEGDIASLAFKESGAITSMSEADGYIEIPVDVDLVEKGEVVTVKLF
jgi:molybdenum cofactor synthesis domain-containing protein